MSVTTMLVCAAFGPALGSDNVHTREMITDLKINRQEISFQSHDQNGKIRNARYKTIEWAVMDCPGTVMAETKKGELAFVKNMATMLTGEWQGFLVYETPEGVKMRAPIACEKSPHPSCTNHQEEIPGWNL